ncbi:MAG TPA: TonB-dependent receptor [Novosphingobium sp.]|nr:TonB-dependent receptor [Novosphingobium sp.]
MSIKYLAATAGTAGLILAAVPALGQTVPLPDDAPQQDGAHHDAPDKDIVVTGVLQSSRLDALSGVAVVQGADLVAATRPSIGETLAHTPGVSATSFGPSASRPVLRGLQGERVRVLTDGIGAVDVSNTSADHATIVNPLLAERIEVLRGPQSLLYGSSAIGGVVNVIDRRIPNAVPESPFHLGAIASYGSAANERAAAAAMDVPLGGGWVGHLDGSYLKTDDLRIGGFALSPKLRREALASALLPAGPDDADFAANAAVSGKLPNTASETWNAAVGLAYIGEKGQIGVAYSHYDSLYGIPIRFATKPGQGQEAPRLDVAQDRVDARVQLDLGGSLIDSATFRYAFGDYRHFELEETGAIGTAFYDQGMEGRLELKQAKRGAWSGAIGGQFLLRDFNVIGAEAFLPKNSTAQLGVFTLQQLELDRVKLEGGVRFEHGTVRSQPRPEQVDFVVASRSFDTLSFSGGAALKLSDGWRIGANVSRTARAPAAEELFSNGPHAGTEAFEIGNPDFKVEKSWGGELILRGRGDDYRFEASAYHTWFSDFIYQDLTGASQDGLPVFQFRQADAKYYGFEVEGSVTLARFGETELAVDGLVDYVHATIDGSGPAPRIPPLRMLGGIGVKSKMFDVRGEVERVTGQNRVSNQETATPGFTLVNAELNVRPWGTERPLSFTLSANNIFDVDARRHASVLKDYAPLAGRDFRIAAKFDF